MLNTVALSLPFNVNRNFTRVLVVVKLATNCTCTECKEKKTKVLLVAFFFCNEKWVINSIFDNRLRVVPHFSSGIVERAKRERAWKSPLARNGDTRLIFLSPRRVSPFLAWGDFHARSRFARSTIPEEKWGTTRTLIWQINVLGWQSS